MVFKQRNRDDFTVLYLDFHNKKYWTTIDSDTRRPKKRWRDKLDIYDKDWPWKALHREKKEEGGESFTLQWDDHGRW